MHTVNEMLQRIDSTLQIDWQQDRNIPDLPGRTAGLVHPDTALREMRFARLFPRIVHVAGWRRCVKYSGCDSSHAPDLLTFSIPS